MKTQLSTAVSGQTTDTLLRWRESDLRLLDELCLINADPTSPVRDAKESAKAIERHRASFAEVTDELRTRGLAVDEVETVDQIKNRARSQT
jgi:hypothetical protein